MAITNLTNTTWNIPAGWTASAGYGQFNINLYFEEDYNYNFFSVYIGYGLSGVPGDFTYPSTSNSIVFNGSSWPTYTSTSSFTITITGGEDATNTKLISWLETNGTQVIDMTPKEQFINQLNELSDVINEKAKTSGKMTISKMIENVKGISGSGSGEPINITSLTVSAQTGSESNYLNYLRFGADIIYIEHGLSGLDTMTITSNVPLVLCEREYTNYQYIEANTEATVNTSFAPTILRVLKGGDVTIQYYVKYD